MRAAASCKISILRGTETSTYDDEVDSTAVVYSDVPCSIIEQTRRTYLPAENAFRVIRSYACRVGSGTDIRKGDRIRNQRNGRVYIVTDLAEPESSALQPDISFTASQIGRAHV